MRQRYRLSSFGLAGLLRASCSVRGLPSLIHINPGLNYSQCVISACLLERSDKHGARVQDSTIVSPCYGRGMAASRYVLRRLDLHIQLLSI